MKVTVSFELELSENPALNIKSLDDLRGSLQNLGSFFHELHLTNSEKILNTLANPDPEPLMQEALLEANRVDALVSAQLFNNYRVQGKTEDGHVFDFTHQEPGYKEEMIIDGQVTGEY